MRVCMQTDMCICIYACARAVFMYVDLSIDKEKDKYQSKSWFITQTRFTGRHFPASESIDIMIEVCDLNSKLLYSINLLFV